LRPALSPLPVAIAASLWGQKGVTAKVIIGHGALDGVGAGCWRLAPAAPALALIVLLVPGQGRWSAVKARDLPGLAAVDLTMAHYQVTFYGAVAKLGVSLAVLIAAAVLGERLAGMALAGAALLVAGVCLSTIGRRST
jgi:drug/metabolite transporter (DMT)-like permease